MKRLLFFIYFQFILISVAFSQPWPKTYPQWNGSSPYWLINYYDKGYMFLLDYDANKYAIIVKTDINGNVLWYRYIGSNQSFFRLGQIDQTKDNGIIYCSSFDKYDPAGSADPFIIKFDPCGEMQWCSVINTPGIFDCSSRVRQTPKGDYILLTAYSDPNPINRFQIYKFDSSGSLFWKHNYPGDSITIDEEGFDLKVLNDGYLITGMCFSPDSGQSGIAFERPYFIKTDTAGNEIWRLIYGRDNGYTGNTVSAIYTIESTSGNFYDVGWHSNYCDTPSLRKCLSDGTQDFNQDIFPTTCPGGCSQPNWLDDTTMVIETYGTVNGTFAGKWMKMDTLGNEKFSKSFSQSWIQVTNFSIVDSYKKNVGLSGTGTNLTFYKLNQDFDFDSIYTHQYVYDSLCPHPIVSDTIDPNCDLIVSVDDSKTFPQASRLKVYPNPATKHLSVEFPKVLVVKSGHGKYPSSKEYYQWKSTFFEVYDLQGKKVFEKEIPKAQQQLEMDISNWQKGMYYFRLVYDKQTVDGVKVIIN